MFYDVLQSLSKAIEKAQPVALATVVDVDGASPAQPGYQLVVFHDGSAIGNVGGGELETRIRQEAQTAIAEGRAHMVRYALREEGPEAIGMLCGGHVTVFVDPYIPKPNIVIVGGGHIGQPLAEMARVVGYDVQVVDAKPERATAPHLDLTEASAQSYAVIITEDHRTDEQFLRTMLHTPVRYIGLIGSRRKIDTIFEHLRHDGYVDDQLARVRAPIGLNLGGRQPAEIALAILAEIESVRHGGNGQPRSAVPQVGSVSSGPSPTDVHFALPLPG